MYLWHMRVEIQKKLILQMKYGRATLGIVVCTVNSASGLLVTLLFACALVPHSRINFVCVSVTVDSDFLCLK